MLSAFQGARRPSTANRLHVKNVFGVTPCSEPEYQGSLVGVSMSARTQELVFMHRPMEPRLVFSRSPAASSWTVGYLYLGGSGNAREGQGSIPRFALSIGGEVQLGAASALVEGRAWEGWHRCRAEQNGTRQCSNTAV